MKKLFYLVAVAFAAIFGLSSCLTEDDTAEIVGEWSVSRFNYESYVIPPEGGYSKMIEYTTQRVYETGQRLFKFFSDGTGSDTGYVAEKEDESIYNEPPATFTWKLQGDILTINAPGKLYDNIKFEVQRKNKSLNLQYSDEANGAKSGVNCLISMNLVD